MAQKWGTHGT
jgi:hypothetical protein